MTASPQEASAGIDERVRALAEEIIAGTSLYLVDLNVRGNKGSRVVEVFIDSDDAMDVDRLAIVSRELEFLIDTEDLIDGKYHLNVSSPGLDRPLALPRQYRKNVGRLLQVHHRKPDGTGNTEVTGELKTAHETGIEVSPSPDEVRRIAYEDILWAKVKLPW